MVPTSLEYPTCPSPATPPTPPTHRTFQGCRTPRSPATRLTRRRRPRYRRPSSCTGTVGAPFPRRADRVRPAGSTLVATASRGEDETGEGSHRGRRTSVRQYPEHRATNRG